jgi:hypothetical protein
VFFFGGKVSASALLTMVGGASLACGQAGAQCAKRKLCLASPVPATSTPLVPTPLLKVLSRTLEFPGASSRGSPWRPPLWSLAVGPRGSVHSLCARCWFLGVSSCVLWVGGAS